MKLSAITITKNEAQTIQRCVASTKNIVQEHIVVDSNSTDATVDLARASGAQVITHDWPGYGPQKNVGLDMAHGEWALFIDADEEVSPVLAQEIAKTLASPNVDFYWLCIVTVFLGKPLYHLYGHNARLFKKSAGHWSNETVHEQVETRDGSQIKLGDNQSQILSQPLLHHSHSTVSSYLERMHQYTTLDAQQMSLTGQHRSGRPIQPSWFLPWRLAIRQFIKLVFYRGGWHDGWVGLTWCYLSAYYEYEMAKKYLKIK